MCEAPQNFRWLPGGKLVQLRAILLYLAGLCSSTPESLSKASVKTYYLEHTHRDTNYENPAQNGKHLNNVALCTNGGFRYKHQIGEEGGLL